MWPLDKSHQRNLLFLVACQTYDVYSCHQNRMAVLRTWETLSVSAKHDFRKAVRLKSVKARITALLVLVGM